MTVAANREAAVIRHSSGVAPGTVRDSIVNPPRIVWSDSHTTIGETVSSKFKFPIGTWRRLLRAACLSEVPRTATRTS